MLEPIVRRWFEKERAPGLAFGVVSGGEFVHKLWMGVAQRRPAQEEEEVKANQVGEGTAFRIASMTKSFMGVAVLLLRDEGKLELEDPVERHLPSVKMRGAKVRQLLTMAAGLPEDDPWADRLLDMAPEALLETLSRDPPSLSRDPGSGFEYSNLSYAILGLLVSAVSGMPFQKFISSRVLEPLGMANTHWDRDHVLPPEKRAVGYRRIPPPKPLPPIKDASPITASSGLTASVASLTLHPAAGTSSSTAIPSASPSSSSTNAEETFTEEEYLHDGVFGAMGGIISTLEDMARYASFHMSAYSPGVEDAQSRLPLQRTSLREAHREAEFCDVSAQGWVESYAFGLRVCRTPEKVRWLRHGGGVPGFGSEWRFFPDASLALITLSNLTYFPGFHLHNELTRALLILHRSSQLALSKSPSPTPILRLRAQQLIALLSDSPLSSPSSYATAYADIISPNLSKDVCIATLQHQYANALRLLSSSSTTPLLSEVVPQNWLRGAFSLSSGPLRRLSVFLSLTPEPSPRIQQIRLSLFFPILELPTEPHQKHSS